MTLSPKARFLLNEAAAKAHNELSASTAVHSTLETALAQMVIEQGHAPDIAMATRYHFEIAGAHRFIAIWLSLGEKHSPPPTLPPQNLRDPDEPITRQRQKPQT